MKPDFTLLGTPAKQMLVWLGFCCVIKGVALAGFAYNLAQAIVGVINKSPIETFVWRAVAFAVLRALIQWAITIISARTASGIKAEFQTNLLKKSLRLSSGSKHTTGEINTLATTGLGALDNYFTQFFPALVATATIPWMLMLWIGYWDWISAVIILLTLGLVPFFMVLIGLHTQDSTKQAREQLVSISHQVIELAQGLPVIVGLGKVKQQGEAFSKILDKYRKKTMEVLRVAFMSSLALELISTLSVALVAVSIGIRLVYGTMTLQVGLMVLILAAECYLPLREIGAGHHASEEGVDTLKSVRSILDEPDATAIQPDAGSYPLELHNFQVAYSDQPWLGAPLSATIEHGTIAALTGVSGAGKSTVLKVIAGLETSEDVRINGTILTTSPTGISYVPQHPRFYSETVADELKLYASKIDVSKALGQFNLQRTKGMHPADLSPGEQRRLALARVIMPILQGIKDSTLVLLDEPTAHLDKTNANLVRSLIQELSLKTSILLVSHESETIGIARQQIQLAESGARNSNEEQSYEVTDIRISSQPSVELEDIITKMSVWRMIKELGLNTRLYWFSILLGIFAAIAAIALSSTSAWLIVRASEHPPIMYLTVAIVGVRFFGIARAVCRYFERLDMHNALFTSMVKLRNNMWQNLAQEGLLSRRSLDSSHAVKLIIEQGDQLRDLIPRAVNPLIASITAGCTTVLVLAWLEPSSFVWFFSLSVCGLVLVPQLSTWLEKKHSAETLELKTQRVHETSSFLLAADDLKANHRDQAALHQVEKLNEREAGVSHKLSWQGGFTSMLTLLIAWSVSAVILFSAKDWHAQGMSSGMVAVCALTPLAMTEIFLTANQAQVAYASLKQLVAKIGKFLDKPTPDERPSLPAAIKALSMDDVAARWSGQNSFAVKDITFKLPEKDVSWLSIIGPSGSGKSTLLSVIMGFLPYEQGKYALLSQEKSFEADQVKLTGAIAWCPQESHIFNSTIRGNLILGADSHVSDEKLETVLHEVGFTRNLPNGLDTQVGSSGAFLSGGEKQRLAVARTLLSPAHVVLLDEPTAHLDEMAAEQLMKDLRAALQGKLVVLITHHHHDIADTDQLLKL